MSVKFPLNEQSLFVSWAVVLRCPGQRQLDKVRCPEAAALCSKARPFAPYRAFSVQRRAARPAKASPFGSNGDDRRQWRKQGEAVGAAASRMRAVAKQTLGAATRAVARRRRDGEGKPVTAKPPHSDEQTLLSERYYRCAFASRQRPCPLRRFAPALPKGEPFRTPHRTARSLPPSPCLLSAPAAASAAALRYAPASASGG